MKKCVISRPGCCILTVSSILPEIFFGLVMGWMTVCSSLAVEVDMSDEIVSRPVVFAETGRDAHPGTDPDTDQIELVALLRAYLEQNDPMSLRSFFNLIEKDIDSVANRYAAMNAAQGITSQDLKSLAACAVFKHLATYRPDRARVRSWVRYRARWAILDAHREWIRDTARWKFRSLPTDDIEAYSCSDSGSVAILHDMSLRAVEDRLDAPALVAAIEAFPTRNRTDRHCIGLILARLKVLRCGQHDSLTNIAAVMDMPIATASRISRAHLPEFCERLARHLRQLGFTPENWGGR